MTKSTTMVLIGLLIFSAIATLVVLSLFIRTNPECQDARGT